MLPCVSHWQGYIWRYIWQRTVEKSPIVAGTSTGTLWQPLAGPATHPSTGRRAPAAAPAAGEREEELQYCTSLARIALHQSCSSPQGLPGISTRLWFTSAALHQSVSAPGFLCFSCLDLGHGLVVVVVACEPSGLFGYFAISTFPILLVDQLWTKWMVWMHALSERGWIALLVVSLHHHRHHKHHRRHHQHHHQHDHPKWMHGLSERGWIMLHIAIWRGRRKMIMVIKILSAGKTIKIGTLVIIFGRCWCRWPLFISFQIILQGMWSLANIWCIFSYFISYFLSTGRNEYQGNALGRRYACENLLARAKYNIIPSCNTHPKHLC